MSALCKGALFVLGGLAYESRAVDLLLEHELVLVIQFSSCFEFVGVLGVDVLAARDGLFEDLSRVLHVFLQVCLFEIKRAAF